MADDVLDQRIVKCSLVPRQSEDVIGFSVDDLRGDVLLASGGIHRDPDKKQRAKISMDHYPTEPGLTNPYTPPNETATVAKMRDWDRDECPVCLTRHNLWSVMNTVGPYVCPNCSTRLTLTVGPMWTHATMVGGTVLLVGYFVSIHLLGIRVPVYFFLCNIPLIILSFWGRRRFGYLHPYQRKWIRTRSDIAASPEQSGQ